MLAAFTSATALTATGTPTFATFYGTSTLNSILNGGLNIGTTTAQSGLLTVGTSTAPQLLLSDNSGNNLWSFRSIANSLYIATSTATATSSVAALTITPNAQVLFTSGNQAAPSISFYNNVNTGIFDSNNILGFSTAGSEQMRIDSAGRVGIGTTTPFALLSLHALNGATNTTLFQISSSTASATTSLFSVSNTGLTTVGDTSGTGDANFQFAADANAWDIGYDSSNKAFKIASSTNFSSNVALTILKNNLNVGIGSTTPWRAFSVTGTVGFDGLTAGAGTLTSLCMSGTKEVQTGGSNTCAPSSLRFKHDIISLSSTSSLAELMQMRPVSFVYNGDNSNTQQTGFIAEEMNSVDTRLVDFDINGDGLPYSVKYGQLTAVLAGAVQAQQQELDALTGTSTASSTPEMQSFAASFFYNLFSKVTRWLADATNGIGKLFAQEVHTNTLCVKKTDGAEVCITGDELAAILAGTSTAAQSSTAQSQPPIISVNGNNPASISIGATYNDLGAIIVGPQGDLNLGLHAIVDGGATTTLDQIVIGTTQPGTHTILYFATDQNGTTGYATRSVVVYDQNATTTNSTSTSTAMNSPTSSALTPVVASTTAVLTTDSATTSTTATTTGTISTTTDTTASSTTP